MLAQCVPHGSPPMGRGRRAAGAAPQLQLERGLRANGSRAALTANHVNGRTARGYRHDAGSLRPAVRPGDRCRRHALHTRTRVGYNDARHTLNARRRAICQSACARRGKARDVFEVVGLAGSRNASCVDNGQRHAVDAVAHNDSGELREIHSRSLVSVHQQRPDRSAKDVRTDTTRAQEATNERDGQQRAADTQRADVQGEGRGLAADSLPLGDA
jgi:hypothetical protein